MTIEVSLDQDRDPLVRSESVGFLDVGDETVVVDEELGCTFVLDPIASFVWDGLVNGLSVAAIVDELAPAFDAPVGVISNGVSKLVEKLSSLGVLTPGHRERLPPSGADECAADADLTTGAPDARLSAFSAFDERHLAVPPNP